MISGVPHSKQKHNRTIYEKEPNSDRQTKEREKISDTYSLDRYQRQKITERKNRIIQKNCKKLVDGFRSQ
jgi:hypothetical protein